jgi:hypothetical protein
MEALMTTNHARKIFVNLPVRDLQRSIEFFTKLGFAFNPNFTDDKCTCMIISEEAFVMLIVESRFKDFTSKQICDTSTSTESLFCLSAGSRAEVDELVNKALEVGGTPAQPPQDHGYMYYRSFHDLDGHHWEVMYMDTSAIPPQQ